MMITVLLLAVSMFGNAQEKEKPQMDPAQRAEMQTKRMQESLGLSEEQTAKILQINQEFAANMEKRKSEQQAEKDARREEIKALRDGHRDQINSVLTPEQQKQWLAQRKEQRPKGSKRGEYVPESPEIDQK